MRRIMTAATIVAAAVVLIPGAALASGGNGVGSAGPAHYEQPRGHTTASSTNPLIDHGGPVVSSAIAVPIFWGPTSQFPADIQQGVTAFLKDLAPSSYVQIATQYMRGSTTSMSMGSSLTDPSAPPVHSPSVSTVANEVLRLVGAPNPNAIYLVFTSNFPKGGGFCAWHSDATTVAGQAFQIAYIPNAANVPGCQVPNPVVGYSNATQAALDSTVHEFMEAITDPELNAWYDKSGQEIGDKCNNDIVVFTLNKLTWDIQGEWSNHANGCVTSG